MTRILLNLLLILALNNSVDSQNYNNNWILQSQQSNGLNFNQYIDGIPDTLAMPAHAQRARTVISNSNGQLRLYLGWDGRLYDSFHQIVDGSSELDINPYGSHSSLLFPCPGESNVYYLVYTNNDPPVFYYALIDVSGNNPEFVEKNILLHEDLYAWSTQLVRDHNEGVWLMAKNEGTDELHTFRFSGKNGPEEHHINRLPAPSSSDAKGPFLAVTPTGEKFATRIYDTNEDPSITYLTTGFFNQQSGKIEDLNTIDTFKSGKLIRSLAFSPSGDQLYVNTSKGREKTIDQYDLTHSMPLRQKKSSYTLLSKQRLHWGDFAMMTGPDGKIYFSKADFEKEDSLYSFDKMGIITRPELPGPASDVISHDYAKWGRPPHIPVGLMRTGYLEIDHNIAERRNSVNVRNLSHEPKSIRINFFNGGRLVDIVDEGTFSFPGPGEYRAEAILDYGNSTRIIYQTFNIFLTE